MFNTHFDSPFGGLELHRYSRSRTRTESNLQAWDAADQLLLAHLAEAVVSPGRVLILNDSAGALACALARSGRARALISAGDSWQAQRAAQDNLARNQLGGVDFFNSLELPSGPVQTVLVKLPKSLRFLHDQLARYFPLFTPTTRFIFAGMVKHMSAGHFNVIESVIGPTSTSLAHKKARLIFAQLQMPAAAIPDLVGYDYKGLPVRAMANVFAGDKLDIGARCLLEHFKPLQSQPERIADLGCGNGVLGLWAARQFPHAQVDFFDESCMAVASVKDNAVLWGCEARCDFYWGDALAQAGDDQYDIILCNPPFHQQQVVGDFIARQMFHDARRCLKPGGELWVVGNRHLNYHQLLKRLFGQVNVRSGDKKFVVITATKPRQ